MVDEFLTLVKKRLLRWYGYISRSSDTYDKDNSAGDSAMSKKRRRDGNIKEWTGMGFKYSPTAVERYCCNVICGAPTTIKVKGLA